jgi:hypothetical protein
MSLKNLIDNSAAGSAKAKAVFTLAAEKGFAQGEAYADRHPITEMKSSKEFDTYMGRVSELMAEAFVLLERAGVGEVREEQLIAAAADAMHEGLHRIAEERERTAKGGRQLAAA